MFISSQEENNLLKNQNDDLIVKLRKTETILSRIREELAHFRQTNGRSPYINFDKEQILENKLKVSTFQNIMCLGGIQMRLWT